MPQPKKGINSLTVAELIEYLEQFPKESKVMFSHPSHDYWKTELAGNINTADEQRIKWSDYHSKWQIDNDEEDEVGPDATDNIVVILS